MTWKKLWVSNVVTQWQHHHHRQQLSCASSSAPNTQYSSMFNTDMSSVLAAHSHAATICTAWQPRPLSSFS